MTKDITNQVNDISLNTAKQALQQKHEKVSQKEKEMF